MLKCLTMEVFSKPHVSILTSPTHPKYSKAIHWHTEGPVKSLDTSPAPHHTRTLWQRHAAIQFSGRAFSCLSMTLYFLVQSPIHPLHIFQLPQQKQQMYYRQQSHCNPNVSSVHNSSCSRERTKSIMQQIFKIYCAMYTK